MTNSTVVDVRDILGDLEPLEKDLRNVASPGTVSRYRLSLDESKTPPEDPASEILNLNDVVSLSDFPVPDTVPAAYIQNTERSPVSRSYKPRKSKAWTQRKSYELFMGCLTWLKSNPEAYFAQTYWAEAGVAERSRQRLVQRYPILKNVVEQIHAVQEARLLEGAATEKLHPGFIKFYLNCRFQDKYIPHTETKQEIVGNVNQQQVQVVFEEVTKTQEVK